MRTDASGTRVCQLALAVLIFGAALYPGSLARVFLVIGFTGVVAFRGDREFSISSSRLPLVLMVLIAYLMVASLWSGDLRPALLNSVSYAALTFGATVAALKLDWRNIISSVALCLRSLLLVNWVLIFAGGFRPGANSSSDEVDVSGLFFHSNLFATVCVIAVITFVAEWHSHTRRFWSGLWVAISLWSLWTSDSRTGQIVLFVVLCAVVFVKWARRDRSSSVASLGILAILTAGAVISIVGINTATISSAMGRGQDFTGRTDIWSATLREVLSSPWIGTGFLTAWRDDSVSAMRIRSSLGFRAAHAHNGYLDVWLQLGVVGLVLVLAVVFLGAYRALRAYWKRQDDHYLWAIAICVAAASYNLTETRFTLAISWVIAVVIYAKISDELRLSKLADQNSEMHGEVSGVADVPASGGVRQVDKTLARIIARGKS